MKNTFQSQSMAIKQGSLIILAISLDLGGIKRKIIDMVNYLDDYRPNLPIYILLKRHTRFDRAIKIKNKKVKIINYQDWHRFKIPFFFPIFVLIKTWQLKPRAILAFLDLCSWSAVLAKLVFFWRKIVVVLSEDHYTSKIVASYNYSKLRFYLIRWLYPKADLICLQSKTVREDLINNFGLSRKKIRIICNWTYFNNRNKIQSKKMCDLIFVGRLNSIKRIQFLLKGVKEIKKNRPNISLWIVGDGEERTKLEFLVHKWGLLKNVEFLGVKKEVYRIMSKAKLLVLASKFESSPIVLLEAMSVGVPVVTSNFQGVREVIKNGENGFIYKDLKEFVKLIQMLLENENRLKKIIKNAKEIVKVNYSPENTKMYFDALSL